MVLYELLVESKVSIKGRIWCTDGSLLKPEVFYNSPDKVAYGYAISDHKVARITRSVGTYDWYRASDYCDSQSNAGINGHLPSIEYLVETYRSIMFGDMKDDLITAGIYNKCNYTLMSIDSNNGWLWIWSETEKDSKSSYFVDHGGHDMNYDKRGCFYVIPFFDI